MAGSSGERGEEEEEEEEEEDPSYPPIFRRRSGSAVRSSPDGETVERREITTVEASIPTLELDRLDAEALSRACRELGIFRLSNHGVPSELVSGIRAAARGLMSMPFEEKGRGLVMPPAARYFWGTAAPSLKVERVNWVEGIDVPPGDGGGGGDVASSFRYMAGEYRGHMARISRRIFGAMAVDLGLEDSVRQQLDEHLAEGDGTLRVYRYPHCPDPESHLGMQAHTDTSIISIISEFGGSDTGGRGLQVTGDDGRWLDVAPPASGELVVNLGDMMQAMSGDEYRSVTHRVAASVGGKGETRMSICYFAFPRDDVVIRSPKYRAFTYPDFSAQVQRDIMEFGARVGLGRFRFGDPNYVPAGAGPGPTG